MSTPNLTDHLNASVNAPIGAPPAHHTAMASGTTPFSSFLLYLAFHAKKNLRKLSNGSSYIMISYYALVWVAAILNLAWSALQSWQCSGGKAVGWNLVSLVTASAMMCLVVAFLLQDNDRSGVDALAQTFFFSGIVVSVDVLLKH